MRKLFLSFIALFFSLASFSQSQTDMKTQKKTALPKGRPGMNILAFSRTTGFYHDSKPSAIKALYEIAHENKWSITFTEDSTFFTDNELAKYNVVIFLLTSGNDLLNDEEKQAFQRYIENGGGFLGIHSATDTEYKWPFFEILLGAHFIGHPPVHEGKLIIENRNHPATSCFPADTVKWTDEYYSFDRNPRNNKNVKVLVSIDEKSYNINENLWFKNVNIVMGDHPLIWCQKVGKGRSIQSALGHSPDMYGMDIFRKHIKGSLLWAGGKAESQ
jgi:uncharacterized protein